MEQDNMDQENIIDQTERELDGNPATLVTHFEFLHPPGNDLEVSGLHYTINADGKNIQVYIVRGDGVTLVQGGVGQASENSLTTSTSADSFGALVDLQHTELANIQDHLVRAAEAMADSFNISQSFLKS